MNISLSLAVIGVFIFLAHLFARFFERTNIPDVPFLILLGLCLQPVSTKILPGDPNTLSALVGTLALISVLVEGGLDLPFAIIQRTARQAVTLATLGFVVSAILVGTAAHLLLDLRPMSSLLVGTILGSTSPTVIIPLVRKIGMKIEAQAILSLESVATNVLSFIITFALLDACRVGQVRPVLMIGQAIFSLLVSPALGFMAGLLWLRFFTWIRRSGTGFLAMFAFAFITFGLVEAFQCSGFTAALVFGMTLGNGQLLRESALGRYLHLGEGVISESERRFFSETVFILKSLSFVYIGLTVRLNDPTSFYAGLFLTCVIFILRVPVSRLSVNRTTYASDASMIAAMSPKGLAVAALSSLAVHYAIPGSEQIKNLSFAIIFLSICMTSILVFLLKSTPFQRCYLWIFSSYANSTENTG